MSHVGGRGTCTQDSMASPASKLCDVVPALPRMVMVNAVAPEVVSELQTMTSDALS